MLPGKKALILLGCMAVMLFLLISSVSPTLAYNSNSISESGSGLRFGFYKINADGSSERITHGSADSLFSRDLRWEPGSMHAVTLLVENTDVSEEESCSFDYWIFPHAPRTESAISFFTENSSAQLEDVLDVYLYDGAYDRSLGRPNLAEWNYLGALSELPPETKTPALGRLGPGASGACTLLLKMRESAGNEYQGRTVDVYVSLMVEQLS